MSRTKTVNIRLSDIEHQALKQYAKSVGMPMSEVLRDYVKTLVGDLSRSPAIHPDPAASRQGGDSAQSG